MGNLGLILLFLLYIDSWTPRSSSRHWPRSRNLAAFCPGSCDFFVPTPLPPPPKKKERYVTASSAVTSFLFWGSGLAHNEGVRVGLVLEAGLFVSNPKFRDSWTPRSSPRHWPRSRNLAAFCPVSCDFLCHPPPPPTKKERYVIASTAVTSFLFMGSGLAPNEGVRVGLVLEAGLFVSNPKFRDRVFEYSTLTQAAGAVVY